MISKVIRGLLVGALLIAFSTWAQEERETPFKVIRPSDCPDCGQDCLEPPLILRVDEQLEELEGGMASASQLLTKDDLDVCARYDGRDEDTKLVIALDNMHTVEYRFTVQESAKEIFSSKVPPGRRLEKEIAPQSDRRYTFRITIDELTAEQPQARAGFMMIRGYLDDQSPSSAISFILTPVPGEK